MACEILVPRPGIEPMTSALGKQNLSHWTTGDGLPTRPPPTLFFDVTV